MPRASDSLVVLGDSSSAAVDALTVAPPGPVVEPCLEDRLLSAAALRLSKHDVACALATASRGGATLALAVALSFESWPRPTSATSGGCISPAPPTTLLVLVRRGSRG